MHTEIQSATSDEAPARVRLNALKQFSTAGRGFWSAVADADWNNWRWQLKHRITTLEQLVREDEVTSSVFCLIVTRGHNHDEEALYHLAVRGARYVGLIGSRRKIKLIFEDLLEKASPKMRYLGKA